MTYSLEFYRGPYFLDMRLPLPVCLTGETTHLFTGHRYEQGILETWRTRNLRRDSVISGLLVAQSVGLGFQYSTGREAKLWGRDEVW